MRKYYLDSIFDDFMDDMEPVRTPFDVMKCDIYEKDGKYHIIMDVPGYDKEDINIEVDNGYLTISAETKEEENEEKKNYIRRERRYGKFSRSFYVGDIDADSIEAEFKKGTLKVCVPKAEERSTKKQIEIK